MPRILVVDDEARIASFVSRALSASGYTVESAYDGTRAVKLFLTGGFDLGILDLRLPGQNGIDVLQRVVNARPDQRIIVLSALGSAELKVEVPGSRRCGPSSTSTSAASA